MFEKNLILCMLCCLVMVPGDVAIAQSAGGEATDVHQGKVEATSSPTDPSGNPLQGSTDSSSVSGEASSNSPDLSAGASDSSSGGTPVPGASSLPPFQLHTLHNEIWSPVKSGSLMQGIKDQSILKGNANELNGSATVNFLQGQVSRVEDGGPMTTIQRLLRPRILSGYTMLRPQTPQLDLFRDLKAQLAKSDPKLNAEIEKAKKEMESQLAHAQPDPRFDLNALKVPNLPAVPTPVLDPGVSTTDPTLQAQIDLAKKQMDWELSHSRRSNYVVPGVPGVLPVKGTSINIDIDSQIRMARTDQSIDMDWASKQMQAELAKAKKVGSIPDIKADQLALDRAKKETNAQVAAAKPEMDAILTSLRVDPKLMMPTTTPEAAQNVDAELSYEKVIPWDKWYAKVAKLYEPLLLRAVAKHGSPEGYNTVSVTVTKTHQVQVALVEPDNSVFDTATLEAYRALNGNPQLEFPAGTHRTQVNFLIDNKHNNPTPVSKVSSKTYTGDKEVQGYKWKK